MRRLIAVALALVVALAAIGAACADEDLVSELEAPTAARAPAAFSGDDAAGCPVTLPNGEKPFEEPRQAPTQHREGDIYTAPLGLNGVTRVRAEDRLPDGTLAPRWMFWRPRAGGSLDIEGRRLDAAAPPLGARFGAGYERSQLWVGVLEFPTAGCWEVTARSDGATMRFVTLVVAPP
jgi:hypothetical protein